MVDSLYYMDDPKSFDLLKPYADAAMAYAIAHPECSPTDALEHAIPAEMRSEDWDATIAAWRAYLDEPADPG